MKPQDPTQRYSAFSLLVCSGLLWSCAGERFESSSASLGGTTDGTGVAESGTDVPGSDDSSQDDNDTLEPSGDDRADIPPMPASQPALTDAAGGIATDDTDAPDAGVQPPHDATDESASNEPGGSEPSDVDVKETGPEPDDAPSSDGLTSDGADAGPRATTDSTSESDPDTETADQTDEGSATDDTEVGITEEDDPPPKRECRESAVLGPDDHCYLFSDEEVTWEQARAACVNLEDGWDLAAINTEDEHAWLVARLTEEVWLAGRNVEGEWLWVNTDTVFWRGGENGDAVESAFVRWEETEPSGGIDSGQCLRYTDDTGDWYWADLPCTREYAFICEQPPPDSP